jgi:hypothetical protein
MNVKNFMVGGIVGGVADFLMGWLLYGILLKDTFPKPQGAGPENMLFIFLGCLCFGFLLSFIFAQGEGVSRCVPGIKVALGVGLFMSLCNNFFYAMYKDSMDVKMVVIDVVASLAIATVVGAVIGVVNGKMK